MPAKLLLKRGILNIEEIGLGLRVLKWWTQRDVKHSEWVDDGFPPHPTLWHLYVLEKGQAVLATFLSLFQDLLIATTVIHLFSGALASASFLSFPNPRGMAYFKISAKGWPKKIMYSSENGEGTKLWRLYLPILSSLSVHDIDLIWSSSFSFQSSGCEISHTCHIDRLPFKQFNCSKQPPSQLLRK